MLLRFFFQSLLKLWVSAPVMSVGVYDSGDVICPTSSTVLLFAATVVLQLVIKVGLKLIHYIEIRVSCSVVLSYKDALLLKQPLTIHTGWSHAEAFIVIHILESIWKRTPFYANRHSFLQVHRRSLHLWKCLSLGLGIRSLRVVGLSKRVNPRDV